MTCGFSGQVTTVNFKALLSLHSDIALGKQQSRLAKSGFETVKIPISVAHSGNVLGDYWWRVTDL